MQGRPPCRPHRGIVHPPPSRGARHPARVAPAVPAWNTSTARRQGARLPPDAPAPSPGVDPAALPATETAWVPIPLHPAPLSRFGFRRATVHCTNRALDPIHLSLHVRGPKAQPPVRAGAAAPGVERIHGEGTSFLCDLGPGDHPEGKATGNGVQTAGLYGLRGGNGDNRGRHPASPALPAAPGSRQLHHEHLLGEAWGSVS